MLLKIKGFQKLDFNYPVKLLKMQQITNIPHELLKTSSLTAITAVRNCPKPPKTPQSPLYPVDVENISAVLANLMRVARSVAL